ncbi:multisubunit potassium/proton antiporter PhaG subunit [Hephaestia caeni]|uniref:Multisubunit potassium/proton antiporter PhaG subunit n=1 Tax=Hephaestia caeni TaxID=645617 RepID=A0A397PEF6_9SPHN|nr:monovalent cation/H(+) antiporter subunit G [Hephaestia caeni]RIA45557.1 multisubunit potassium/proton antiporter PhaG subunit [Hephaestia caeni]
MIQAPDLPLWAAIAVGFFVLLGASITLVGALGLLRMGNFYERIHPPTLGTTLGTACILIASMICFSTLHARPMVHEILIAIFVTLTTPITLMLLARAALYRDRIEGSENVPDDRIATAAVDDDGSPT